MLNLNGKTQDELKALARSIKLTITGGPSLAQATLTNLNTNLLTVMAKIDGPFNPSIENSILSNSLN